MNDCKIICKNFEIVIIEWVKYITEITNIHLNYIREEKRRELEEEESKIVAKNQSIMDNYFIKINQ